MKKTRLDKLHNKFLSMLMYLLVIVTVAILLITYMNNDSKTLFGYTARIVVTGSMEPNIKLNSLNIIEVCDINDINVNDVVCFNYNQDIIHRVVEKTTNENGDIIIHTKGDANSDPDSIEINSEMIIGKVILTYNEFAPLIEKYSISPGNIDIAAVSKTTIIYSIIITIAILLVMKLFQLIGIVIKSIRKEDSFDKAVNEFIVDIDELILYREVLLQLKTAPRPLKKKLRIRYIFNKLGRVRAEMEMHSLHREVNEFKKQIKHCIFIHKLGARIDKNKSTRKHRADDK